ncbi:MAG: right-handed parallel beta-helix repeat-containing protein [Planctomycetes bacterium]|nr:right-handed parallel beta-helix repeat-containing protein [Planctomycetota bacterium]
MSRSLPPARFLGPRSGGRALAWRALLAAAVWLGVPSAASAHSIMIVNDRRSPGVLGDDRLSLHEAILVATDRLQLWELSPAEAGQVIQDPGRFQVDTLIFDTSVFPAPIVLETPLPVLDDPIGDYIDGTNFNQLPIGSILLDGSRLPPGTPIFDIEGSNTGIYGWHLYGATGDAIRIRPSAILPRMHGLLLQANWIEAAAGAGISIRTGARAGISWDAQILENGIFRCAGGGFVFEAGSGALQDARFIVESNFIDGNGGLRGSSPALHGIALIGATSGNDFLGDYEIRRNFVRGSPGCGILIDGAGPGTTWGGILESNSTLANGYGFALQGSSLPGAGANDVSGSLRHHRSYLDLHAAVLAIGGTARGSSGAFVSLSLRDVLIGRGSDIAQIVVGAGAGTNHGVSLSLREVALVDGLGDGLRIEATAPDALSGHDVQVRTTLLEVRGAARAGLALLGGAGDGARVRLQGDSVHVEACQRGLWMHGSSGGSAVRAHDLECTLGAARFLDCAARGIELEGRGGRMALRLRGSGVERSVGEGVRASATTPTALELDLGQASSWGLNSFLDNAQNAVALGTGAPSAFAVGNWWGRRAGAAPAGAPNGVDALVDASAPLSNTARLRLDLDSVTAGLGGDLRFDLPDAVALALVFVGAQAIDLSSQGRGIWLDPQDPVVSAVAVLPGGGPGSIPIPRDPALVGIHVLCQAFAPAEGLASPIRALWIQ